MTAEERLAIIRDAFLEGRDREAVETLLDLMVNEATKLGHSATPFSVGPGEVMLSVPMFSPQAIAPGELAQIYSRPQRAFRARRLLVVDECASFDIHQIYFGTVIQGTANQGPLSASLFSPRRGMPLTFDAVVPGMDMVMAVENKGERAMPFRGAFWGVVPP